MKNFFILLLAMSTFGLCAEIPADMKEMIEKSLDGDKEFKRAFLEYAESIHSLYDPKFLTDKENFKIQYENYIKRKSCMQFLTTSETFEIVMPFMLKLDQIERQTPVYSKIQMLMEENYQTKDKITKSPKFDGYKFCTFKVSEKSMNKSKESLSDKTIMDASITLKEKINFISNKDENLKKSLNIMTDNYKNAYTNSKISKVDRNKMAQRGLDDLFCVLYFTPEDKMETIISLLKINADETKKDPNYLDDIDKELLNSTTIKMSPEYFNGDYSKCTFKITPTEVNKYAEIKKREKIVIDENYSILQKILEKAHPNIKTMVKGFEQSFSQNSTNADFNKKMFINSFPKYMEQVDQAASFNLYSVLKDPVCRKEIAAKAQVCAGDEKYKLLGMYTNLLLITCTQDYKAELSKVCKFEGTDKPK